MERIIHTVIILVAVINVSPLCSSYQAPLNKATPSLLVSVLTNFADGMIEYAADEQPPPTPPAPQKTPVRHIQYTCLQSCLSRRVAHIWQVVCCLSACLSVYVWPLHYSRKYAAHLFNSIQFNSIFFIYTSSVQLMLVNENRHSRTSIPYSQLSAQYN